MLELFLALLGSIAAFIALTLFTQWAVRRIERKRFGRDFAPPQCLDQSVRTVIDFQQERKARREQN